MLQYKYNFGVSAITLVYVQIKATKSPIMGCYGSPMYYLPFKISLSLWQII